MTPRLVHVTTTDMSLALLLGPQLRAFAEAGYEVIGVSAPGPFVAELEAQGIRHIPLRHATRSAAPHRDVLALAELRALFSDLRPAIVHTHNPKPGVYGRLAARAAGVPAIVNTVHGLYALPDDRWAKRALVYGLELLASRCSQAELVQNPEDVETLLRLGMPRSKVHLLGNGIDLTRFDPGRAVAQRRKIRAEWGVTAEEVVIGAVGRLVAEKGYPELFEAVASIAEQHPQVRLVVIGPAEADKSDALDGGVIREAEAAGVRFLGYRDDVEVLYPAMDLYVLASHREGFPRSAMEAAAMGLPVVATDVRGCRQVVDEGITGRLVVVNDARALGAAIAELVAEPSLRVAMGRAGREKALREFDQQQVIDFTLSTYERLLPTRLERTAAA
jgi:glycosyltransferase involved in cell wall biosynthesis